MAGVLRLPKNDKGRDYVVGDIHGCFDLLEKALASVNFDPEKDRLISVGDLVDRGPESDQCLHYLAQPWFFALRGNHEEMFSYLFRNGKLDVEGVIRNIPNGMAWMLFEDNTVLQDIRDAFDRLPFVIEIETDTGATGFVHADVPEGMNWQELTNDIENGVKKTRDIAQWSRRRIHNRTDDGVEGIDRVFLGHTPLENGPCKLGNCFFIDTGGVFKLIGEHRTEDLYLSIIDIRASDADILSPEPTGHDLVRKMTAGRHPAPAPKPSPPTKRAPKPKN